MAAAAAAAAEGTGAEERSLPGCLPVACVIHNDQSPIPLLSCTQWHERQTCPPYTVLNRNSVFTPRCHSMITMFLAVCQRKPHVMLEGAGQELQLQKGHHES